MNLVWFKRDLRAQDNAALSAAIQSCAETQSRLCCIYVIEPSVWQAADASQRQFDFLRECLRDLYRALKRLGIKLHVVTGEVVPVLTRLHALQAIQHIYSHQETGNQLTFTRDTAVQDWCASAGVNWREFRQHGVVRRLKNRSQWNAHWHEVMGAALIPKPLLDGVENWSVDQASVDQAWLNEGWPDWSAWGQPNDTASQRQQGGTLAGEQLLNSFLHDRAQHYRGGISSPLSATTACSRLSPYLSLGCVSMRQVVQSTAQKIAETTTDAWTRKGLQGFLSRLHWHCHFIQKLESEPSIEWRNMHRGYDGLRENDWNQIHFERLKLAQTGWPLVDACVVMLRETGWLNFRMRAMLVSVAAYPLWLHWKPVGDWLATQFVDYEPGIHWSQMQMQSGTTGINTTRVYNPIKQAKDQDPNGVFVRQWLPALRRVPNEWLFEPWKMPLDVQTQCGVIIGIDWPLPVVDLADATRVSKAALHERRQLPDVRQAKAAVVEKHASRLRRSTAKKTVEKATPNIPKISKVSKVPVEQEVSQQTALIF